MLIGIVVVAAAVMMTTRSSSTGKGDVVLVPSAGDDARQPEDAASEEGDGQLPAVVASAQAPDDVWCTIDDEERRPAADCALWTLADGSGGSISHIASDGELVFAAVNGAITAVDAATGDLRWQWSNPSEYPASGMVADAGTVVVLREADHDLVVLNAADGRVRWRAPLVEQRQAFVALTTTHVLVREPTTLRALRIGDGTQTWSTEVPAGGPLDVVLSVDEVVITAHGPAGLQARSLATGEEVWRSPLSIDREPVNIDGLIAVIATEPTPSLVSLAANTGEPVWQQALPGARHLIRGSDSTLLAVGPTRTDIVEIASGEIVAQVGVGGTAPGAPAGQDQALIASANRLVRIDAGTLGETWTLDGVQRAEGAPTFATANANGDLVVTAVLHDGATLAAFELPPLHAPTPPAECADARPSEALGRLTAWRGEWSHVAVQAGTPAELWVGLPGSRATEPFRVSAQLPGTPHQARLRQFDDTQWHDHVVVDDGGRVAANYPTHWVVNVRFPTPGCWKVEVVQGDDADEVWVPVDDVDAR